MNNQTRYEELSQRLQTSAEFKQSFLDSPKEILAEFGVAVPNSVAIRVHEDTAKVRNLVIPIESALEDETTASNPLWRKAIALAFADRNYKAQLIDNPKQALTELTGESLPEDLEIFVHENSPTLRHLVIFIDSSQNELSEAELEAVAGGIGLKLLSPPILGLIFPSNFE
jgi:hypothetical protein